jgi:hypothetical protein
MIRIKAAEGLFICHLIDEDGDYPECITRGYYPSINTPGGTPPAALEGARRACRTWQTFEAPARGRFHSWRYNNSQAGFEPSSPPTNRRKSVLTTFRRHAKGNRAGPVGWDARPGLIGEPRWEPTTNNLPCVKAGFTS